ncbi:hypothetical protein DNFV4_00608 [Nitrospira tepida]|uniref:Uncharacterized protein n=1 Tax=Nitrospira tepida TaxID=2973512 RepID=A0AA86MW81_9BACT|nr:hypothetical protein [Nitrospira tepida]CAI4030183.1 hypothetical protein DNFV4_00608 [Nitrospira tepida]
MSDFSAALRVVEINTKSGFYSDETAYVIVTTRLEGCLNSFKHEEWSERLKPYDLIEVTGSIKFVMSTRKVEEHDFLDAEERCVGTLSLDEIHPQKRDKSNYQVYFEAALPLDALRQGTLVPGTTMRLRSGLDFPSRTNELACGEVLKTQLVRMELETHFEPHPSLILKEVRDEKQKIERARKRAWAKPVLHILKLLIMGVGLATLLYLLT